jgi:beta-glucanase (GH16 family)
MIKKGIRKSAALVVALSFLLLGQTASSAAVPKVVTAPSISKFATVGTTVKLANAKFSSKATIATAWLHNGKVIAGATKTSYKLTSKQASGTLQVKQSAKISGKTLTAFSNKISIGRFATSGSLTIAYTSEAKDTMKVNLPTLQPAAARVSYQWLRNGFDLPGENLSTHAVASSDKGALVSVKVTFNAPKGYRSLELTSRTLSPYAMTRTYEQVWSDEFNGAAGETPDSSVWAPENGDGVAFGNRGWGNSERQWYKQELSTTDGNGSLVVRATRNGALEQRCYYGQCEWFSSKYVTKGKLGFKYGRFEARIKGAPGNGTWGAFWSLGADIDTKLWPSCGEIDFVELIGRKPFDVLGYSHGLVSWGAGRGATTQLDTDWSLGYHTYAVDWLPDQLVWYVDGEVYGVVDKYDRDWRFDKEFYLIFNLAMGGNLGGAIDPSLTETEMKIDWIRFSKINGIGEVINH